MARPVDPRSRAQACRLAGVHEATVRKLERAGALPPAPQWTAADLTWAKVLTSPGLRTQALPDRPRSIGAEDVLVVPLAGEARGSIHASLLQAIGAVDALRQVPVAVLQIGRWHAELSREWT